MLTKLLTPEIVEPVLASTFIVLIIGGLVGFILLLRQLKTTQQMLLQFQASRQEDIQQLQTSQAATQETVAVTQRETQLFMQDVKALQRDSQALMVEIKTLQGSTQALMADWQKETIRLSRALHTTYKQGTWGEHQLERLVDLADMTKHCDFKVKARLPNGQVPDMIIHLHNNRSIAVDSKAPSQVYLEAVRCEDETMQRSKMKAYANRVKEMVKQLADKEYWKQLEPTLDLVILFIPNEAMFLAAFEHGPDLLDEATKKNVLLASPVTFIALLKAISYGWSQEDRAQHVQQIVAQSKRLHTELETWLRQWQQLKTAIQTTENEFDQAVSRYKDHVLPIIKELGALDSTLRIKEKSFELTPFQNPPDTQEEGHDTSSRSWQSKITRPLSYLRDLLPLEISTRGKSERTTT